MEHLAIVPQTWNAIQTVISAIARKKIILTIANQFLISDDFSAYLVHQVMQGIWNALSSLFAFITPSQRDR